MRRTSRRHSDRCAGFTLVELLLVIAIIGTLMVILAPSVVISRDEPRSVRLMSALASALESYHAAYGAYPPSQMPAGYSNTGGASTGSQCLYYFLMGPRGEGWGTDGSDGGVPPQYVWGPAKDLDADWMVSDQKVTAGGGITSTAPYFCDGAPEKDRAMLYYRADVSYKDDGTRRRLYNEIYNRSDNADASPTFWNPSEEDWREVVINPAAFREAPQNPRSYILIAPGKDREFGFTGGVYDDITNFKRQ